MIDPQYALQELVAAMREAATHEIMPRFRSADFSIRQKSTFDDIVTEADEQGEARMTRRLGALFPGALIVGEEAASADPSLLDRLPEADLAFILDPVDGTINFSAGLPLFAVIGAVSSRGRVVAGAILDPVTDELMSAIAGQGAISSLPGRPDRPLRVRAPGRPQDARGTCFWLDIDTTIRAEIMARAARLPSISILRCSGHEYRLLARGQVDFLLCATARLKPWDHAAGLLLCREAGGYAGTFDGEEWQGLSPASSILCAASQDQWQALKHMLIPAH